MRRPIIPVWIMFDLWDSNCKLLYRIFRKYCKVVISAPTPHKAYSRLEKLRREALAEMHHQEELYLGDGFEARMEYFYVPNEEEEVCQLGFKLFYRDTVVGRIRDIHANNMYMVICLPRVNITLHRACNGRDFPDSENLPEDIVMTTGFVTATPEEERVESLYDLLSYEDRRDIRAAVTYGSQALPVQPKPKRQYRRRSNERGNT